MEIRLFGNIYNFGSSHLYIVVLKFLRPQYFRAVWTYIHSLPQFKPRNPYNYLFNYSCIYLDWYLFNPVFQKAHAEFNRPTQEKKIRRTSNTSLRSRLYYFWNFRFSNFVGSIFEL